MPAKSGSTNASESRRRLSGNNSESSCGDNAVIVSSSIPVERNTRLALSILLREHPKSDVICDHERPCTSASMINL